MTDGEPIQPDPSALTAEGLSPANSLLGIRSKLKEQEHRRILEGDIRNAGPSSSGPGVSGTPIKRSPGRPPGSRNQAKSEESDEAKKQREAEEKLHKKKARANELSEQIQGELNDVILSLIIAQGVPSGLLYKPGQEPTKSESTRFTELGRRFTLDSFQSKAIGRFVAELESTNVGQAATGVANSGPLPLVIYGGISVFAIFNYVKTVKMTMDQLGPLLEAYQRAQENQRQATAQQERQSSGLH